MKMLKLHFPKTIPWFGMDIGGTLTKLVYFASQDVALEQQAPEVMKALQDIRCYLTNNHIYGESGRRDVHLQMDNVQIRKRCGTLHFIRFQTQSMTKFLTLARQKGVAKLAGTMCATGGGAYKCEKAFRKKVNMKLLKLDELGTLVKGILFAELNNAEEVYYYENSAADGRHGVKRTFDFSKPYPFMLVNVGSGVSVLTVRGPHNYKRVMGSSLGGGTFLGLCCLLTGCGSFKEAMQLAAKGSHDTVDKLVKDIYGGDYARFNLSGELVASSFGQMHMRRKRATVSAEDLAKSTLLTIVYNISCIAHLCAANERIDRVLFVGNFLRLNTIAMQLLAHSMDYWSRGAMKALFLQHEGYFSALGCLL